MHCWYLYQSGQMFANFKWNSISAMFSHLHHTFFRTKAQRVPRVVVLLKLARGQKNCACWYTMCQLPCLCVSARAMHARVCVWGGGAPVCVGAYEQAHAYICVSHSVHRGGNFFLSLFTGVSCKRITGQLVLWFLFSFFKGLQDPNR